MAWMKRESPYERRIRELEEEAERVRKNMQQLMKNVPREAVTSSPALGARPAGPRLRSSYQRSVAPPVPVHAPQSLRPEEPSAPVPPDQPEVPARSAEHRPEKFASYLASGSFGTPRSLSRERRIQRNKAIMMLVFALLAIYSLYTWMK